MRELRLVNGKIASDFKNVQNINLFFPFFFRAYYFINVIIIKNKAINQEMNYEFENKSKIYYFPKIFSMLN